MKSDGDIDDFGGETKPKDFAKIAYCALTESTGFPPPNRVMSDEERKAFGHMANVILSQSESNEQLGKIIKAWKAYTIESSVDRFLMFSKALDEADKVYFREKNLGSTQERE